MRAPTLAVAVLLSGLALLWIGRGTDGEQAEARPHALLAVAPTDGLSAVSQPGTTPSGSGPPTALHAPSEARERAAAGPRLSAAQPGVEANDSTVELVIRAASGIAQDSPTVYLLRARDNLRGLSAPPRRSPVSAQSKERWRWSRAEAYGEPLTGLPPWRPVDQTAGDQELSSGSSRAAVARLLESVDEDVRERVKERLAARGPRMEIRAQIPRPGRLDRVFAMAQGRVCMGGLSGNEVVLDFDDRLESLMNVSVVHADGRPAADVPLVTDFRGRLSNLGTAGQPLSDLVRTDEAGRARVMALGGARPCAIVLGARPVRSSFVREGMDLVHQIVLPPVGAIEVQYDHRHGSPPRGKVGREGTLGIEPVSQAPFTFDGEWRVSTRLEDGRATLSPVALHQGFRLEVKEDLSQAVVEAVGPTEPGEVVAVQLWAANAPRLRFVALDEAGMPLSGQTVHVRRKLFPAEPWGTLTDENGAAVLRLDGVAQDSALGVLQVRADPGSGRPNDGLIGERSVDAQFKEGELDLGTWTLGPVPHLVSGRVIDGGGAPVAGATVRVTLEGGLTAESERAGTEWAEMGALRHDTSDSQGRFTIRWTRDESQDSSRELELTATKGAARLFVPAAFQPGDRNVVLVVERPGAVRIDASQLDAANMQGLRLTLSSDADALDLTDIPPGKLIDLKHKRPGSYTCRVGYGREHVALAEKLRILAGETLVDPRLNPISLDHVVQRRTVFVTGPNGESIPSMMLGRVRSGQSDRTTTVNAVDGAFDVVAYLVDPPQRYWIEADGYRRAEVEILRDGMTVQLEAAMQVTLQLTGAQLPGKPIQMMVRPAATRQRSIAVSFNAQGRGSFAAPRPGPYVLGGAPSRRGAATSPAAARPWRGATFMVPEGGGPVEVPAR